MKYASNAGKKNAPQNGTLIKKTAVSGGKISKALIDFLGYLLKKVLAYEFIIKIFQKQS